MTRVHFFEAIERKVDIEKEYLKLEEICAENYGSRYYGTFITINLWIEKNFRKWKKRSNYTSFAELREHLGFPLNEDGHIVSIEKIDINKYLLFCEMILNLMIALSNYKPKGLDDVVEDLIETIKATLTKLGMEITIVDGECMIVEKNAVAIEVADKQPQLAETIIEYNHYLLKGDLDKKRVLLKALADSLEPKRKELTKLNKNQTDDFFYMVNNMNIRHNNCDITDVGKYNAKFALLSNADKEEWYDMIYDQGLALYVILEQQRRNKKIDAFKKCG